MENFFGIYRSIYQYRYHFNRHYLFNRLNLPGKAVNSEKIPGRRIVDAMPEAFVSNARISREVHRRVASGQLRMVRFVEYHFRYYKVRG